MASANTKTAPTGEQRHIPLQQQALALEVGQSVSIAKRLDGDEATKDAIRAAREAVRNPLATVAARAKATTGHSYIVESGEITTRSLDILVVGTLTRME